MGRAVFGALVCAILAGCTRSSSTPSGARHAWTVPHVLRIAELSEPDTLNPYLSDIGATFDVANFIYSYLLVADNQGRMVGDLASEVPSLANGGISSDGRTYVYHLRRDALWHDGKPFTSDDVVASWHAVMNPHNNALGREGYDQVATITSAGANTVIVRLRKRFPPFASLFFTGVADFPHPVLPAHLLRDGDFKGGTLAARPIGTGPFAFVSWARGDRIALVAFNHYFKGRPRLTRIEVDFIPDAETILVELEKHQIDLVPTPQASLFDQYRSIDGLTIVAFPINAQSNLTINASKAGLRDVSVRRAIALLVPYDVLLQKVAHNTQARARNVLPTTALGYEPLRLRDYDPAAAQRLLDKAGWRRGPDGVRVHGGVRLDFTLITLSGFTGLERAAVILQSALKSAGIDITVKTYSYRTVFSPSGPIDNGSFDLAYYGGTLSWDPDLYDELACDRWYPRGQNVYRFCDPKLDALERAGLQTDDSAKRAAIYQAASRVIWSEVPYVPFYGGRNYNVRSADLRNYSVSPAGTWWNAWRWDI